MCRASRARPTSAFSLLAEAGAMVEGDQLRRGAPPALASLWMRGSRGAVLGLLAVWAAPVGTGVVLFVGSTAQRAFFGETAAPKASALGKLRPTRASCFRFRSFSPSLPRCSDASVALLGIVVVGVVVVWFDRP